jgi:hypothetical protein
MDPGLDPLILFSLIYAGNETMAIDLVLKRAAQGSSNFLPQQYSIKALIIAVTQNHLGLAQILLESGVDPFTQDPEFCLRNSWRMDNSAFIEPLYDDLEIIGANCEDRLRYVCSTGFQIACCLEKMEMVKLFLTWRGSPSHPVSEQHRSQQTSAAYVYALCSGKSWLEKTLQFMGITFQNASHVLGSNYLRSHLRIGLQSAMNRGKKDVARRLMDLGSDPCAVAVQFCHIYHGRWHTPLQCAAKQEQPDFVKRLLSMGADPNGKPTEEFGATAIQFAAINGNFEILEFLIKAGGDINAPKSDVGGRTALQGAAEHGRLDMTRHLLELGVDVRGRDNMSYIGAVWMALSEGHRILAQMIQDWKREQYGQEDCEDFETIRNSSSLWDWNLV